MAGRELIVYSNRMNKVNHSAKLFIQDTSSSKWIIHVSHFYATLKKRDLIMNQQKWRFLLQWLKS